MTPPRDVIESIFPYEPNAMPGGYKADEWQVGKQWPYHPVLNPGGFHPEPEPPSDTEAAALEGIKAIFPYDPVIMPYGYRDGEERQTNDEPFHPVYNPHGDKTYDAREFKMALNIFPYHVDINPYG